MRRVPRAARRRGEALKEVVGALIRAKDLPEAVKVAGDIPHDIGRCYALMELAKAHAAAGRKAEVGTGPVPRQALPFDLLSPRVERRALLLRPGARSRVSVR